MNLFTASISTALALFLGTVVAMEIGRRLGLRRRSKELEGARAGLGAVEGSIFGLMGLLLAFTFSGAASRLDARRQLILEEANAIGTAWLRLDLLTPEPRKPLQEEFRRYLDNRLAAYRSLPDLEKARATLSEAVRTQGSIWSRAVAACGMPENQRAGLLLLPAINEMFDIASARTMAFQVHPPIVVFIMLIMASLISALLAGFGMAGSRTLSWLHIAAFAVVLSMTVYVILDMEYPRVGLIRVDQADQMLQDVRNAME
jgi:hypothetical protein